MILYNNWPVTFGQFPNGECNLRHFKRDLSDINHVVTLKYESDADLFHLLLVRQELADVPAILRITYVPYSRMDRASDTYLFSLKVFCDFINSMNWSKVIIYEPHSDVTPALLNNVEVVDVTAHPFMVTRVNYLVGSDYQICYPDVGAFKRYSEKLKTRNPLVGFKRRDFETGKIQSLEISGTLESDTVVIVDDLCSKGGTFVMAAKELKRILFKRIFLVVAHCEKAIWDGEVFSSKLIDRVITTDSIYPADKAFDRLIVVPLTEFR